MGDIDKDSADCGTEMAAELRELANRVERGDDNLLIVLGVFDEKGTHRHIHGRGHDTVLLGVAAGLMLDAQRACD